MRPLLICLLMLWLPVAGAAQLRDLRVWDGPESTRVIFDLSEAAEHKVFTLANPDRIVIDIAGMAKTSSTVLSHAQAKGVVRGVRSAPREDGSLRVVLDVQAAVTPKSFMVEPNAQYGNRLIVELYGQTPTLDQLTSSNRSESNRSESNRVEAGRVDSTRPESSRFDSARSEPAAARVMPAMQSNERPIVIAVDAGHGGEDPGAIGRGGLHEKDASLAMAKRLAALINQQPGMKAVLTRDGDYFIGLRERTVKARQSQADMFVSIHCNAAEDRHTRGSSVYVLSTRGATNEHARWLAHKENSADLVGGLDLGSKDNELAAVLIDLSQASSMEASFDVGGRLLQSLSRINPLSRPEVQQAGFMVLKSPDIPSVLVETAFITNENDERLLASGEYHDQVAQSLLEGIQGYFKSYRPHQQIVEERPRLQKVRRDSATARAN